MTALLVVFLGRSLMSTEIIRWVGPWALVFHVAWEPVLSLGYAIMLWNVVSSPSIFSRALSACAAQATGRWSYSLYLWQWWPCYFITRFMVERLGATLPAQYLSLGLLMAFLIPVGWLSYECLEAPYFRKSRGGAIP